MALPRARLPARAGGGGVQHGRQLVPLRPPPSAGHSADLGILPSKVSALQAAGLDDGLRAARVDDPVPEARGPVAAGADSGGGAS